MKIFFYRPVNADKSNFVSFLVFVAAAASFTAKISSFENCHETTGHWILSQNSEYPRIFRVNGSQSEHAKIAIHWFGEY